MGFLVGVDLGVDQADVVVDGGVDGAEPDQWAGAGLAGLVAVAAVHPPAPAVAQPSFFTSTCTSSPGAGAFAAADHRVGGTIEPGRPGKSVADGVGRSASPAGHRHER
ncbi:hypothetical protein ACQPZA_08925 [Pseudonocardia xinjiangensis]|uniref:hypothetical protein n=1 Tax=Pseudonocardia xinjiangensis TaxID=75289 RepID=UPI003D8AA15D